ncbi:hypothetical protein [Klebsiella pneumoniae]|uniref:hypothetical protein n=1 Tax=Klebsiella pneumoniae TaxID=573 RepID=UPI000E2B0C10|nr:hypothetical protein [Klebsiella pneumoniae]SXY56215.1 Uncharacterised protein [Klebsiella pneumoniae]
MTKSTITREQLLEIIETDHVQCGEASYLARMALAAMDSEPVDEVLSNRPGNDTSTIDRALPVGTQLYRHAQPALVVSADLLHTAASAIEDLLEHTDPNTSYYSGVWADVPGKLRAAMLQAKSLASINPAPALCSLSKLAKCCTPTLR